MSKYLACSNINKDYADKEATEAILSMVAYQQQQERRMATITYFYVVLLVTCRFLVDPLTSQENS